MEVFTKKESYLTDLRSTYSDTVNLQLVERNKKSKERNFVRPSNKAVNERYYSNQFNQANIIVAYTLIQDLHAELLKPHEYNLPIEKQGEVFVGNLPKSRTKDEVHQLFRKTKNSNKKIPNNRLFIKEPATGPLEPARWIDLDYGLCQIIHFDMPPVNNGFACITTTKRMAELLVKLSGYIYYEAKNPKTGRFEKTRIDFKDIDPEKRQKAKDDYDAKQKLLENSVDSDHSVSDGEYDDQDKKQKPSVKLLDLCATKRRSQKNYSSPRNHCFETQADLDLDWRRKD